MQAAQITQLQRETCRQVLDGTSVSHLNSLSDTYSDLLSDLPRLQARLTRTISSCMAAPIDARYGSHCRDIAHLQLQQLSICCMLTQQPGKCESKTSTFPLPQAFACTTGRCRSAGSAGTGQFYQNAQVTTQN